MIHLKRKEYTRQAMEAKGRILQLRAPESLKCCQECVYGNQHQGEWHPVPSLGLAITEFIPRQEASVSNFIRMLGKPPNARNIQARAGPALPAPDKEI